MILSLQHLQPLILSAAKSVTQGSFAESVGCGGSRSIEPAEPAKPLTARQPAKKKREVRLTAAPQSKISYWDEVGIGKPNASALKAALADTVLVDAAWLAQLADAKGVLPRCQDLPLDARVTLEEMERWKSSSTVGVLVVSYPW